MLSRVIVGSRTSIFSTLLLVAIITAVGTVISFGGVQLVDTHCGAGMSALRLARGYTGRNKIVKFEGCYHGHSDSLLVKAGSGMLTFGNPSSAGIPQGTTQHTLVLEYNNPQALKD